MVNVTLFSQILELLPRSIFTQSVTAFKTDKHTKGINSWTHLVCMLFCHLGKAHSLRDITFGLRSITGNASHLGIQKKIPCRSSLSYINDHRDWQMFRDFYFRLKDHFQQETPFLRRKKFKTIKRKIYMLDSTVISLCLKVFDWAVYQHEKGAIKLHTLLDYDGCLPSYLHMTAGSQNDGRHARYMTLPTKSVVVMDRGYQSFRMFQEWTDRDIFFVTRFKEKINYRSCGERELPENRAGHILRDEVIELTEEESCKAYPGKLRRIAVYNKEQKKDIVLLTNNLSWTAATVAELYKQRWSIEIFFKELKQHLKIKSFIGVNENAMWIQIWTALITILLLRVMREKATYAWNLSNLVAFLRFNLFSKIDLRLWLDKPIWSPEEEVHQFEQLNIFGAGGSKT